MSMSMNMSIYNQNYINANNEIMALNELKGRVILIVNVASHCGFTQQYQDLAQLYQQYHEQGLTILAFPCNQFGKQEPGDIASIQQFCQQQYQLPFQVMQKCEVNGKNATQLYQYLKKTAPGAMGSQQIKWNFCKFLVSRNGKKIKRFSPITSPKKMRPMIENFLDEST